VEPGLKVGSHRVRRVGLRHGFREYYNPLTGRGLAARGFGFATLLVDLLAECGFDSGEPSGRARIMQA
jgi:hypothetical protein